MKLCNVVNRYERIKKQYCYIDLYYIFIFKFVFSEGKMKGNMLMDVTIVTLITVIGLVFKRTVL